MLNRREFLKVTLGTAFVPQIGKSWHPQESGIRLMDLERVKAFVEKAIFEIPPENLEGKQLLRIKTCCVDGRRPKNETGIPPECAIPGADAGIMMSILAIAEERHLPKSLKEILLNIFIDLRGGKRNLHFHTDEHAKEENKEKVAGGCGHFRLAKENPKQYNLATGDIELISRELEEISKEAGTQEVLAGKHAESAVVILNDETLGLRHNIDNLGQVFVYNRALHKKIMEALIDEGVIGSYLNDTQIKELKIQAWEICQKQLNVTLLNLAKGQNIYSVTKENGEIKIATAGVVK